MLLPSDTGIRYVPPRFIPQSLILVVWEGGHLGNEAAPSGVSQCRGSQDLAHLRETPAALTKPASRQAQPLSPDTGLQWVLNLLK